ncbi:hypothetical protein C4K68_01955 [Pokkaliibacter plantistimulans]|uniref:Inositol monophosphatase n=1 Tax=Proteobacteria bacterium 228 TaxID=2083153 RepID=A0A2S5KXT7_9PROT|nr:inositol monophosphatase family protein [Pokkaliibacter plantistimulans]PPC79086.1 hypothetical protein C4K68_01955 [Pokkaliibacter plantistimulans]
MTIHLSADLFQSRHSVLDSLGVSPFRCESLLREITDQLYWEISRRRLQGGIAGRLPYCQSKQQWAAKVMQASLAQAFGPLAWVDAEGASDGELPRTYWYYQAIEGLEHFSQSMAMWSASLVLVHQGQTILALVYDPAAQEMFSAVREEGAFCSHEQLQIGDKTQLADAVVATCLPEQPMLLHTALQGVAELAPAVHRLRMMASTSLQLAYVACGRLDGYWQHTGSYNPCRAGALLVEEATGYVSYLHRQGQALLVASNRALSPLFNALLGWSC